MVKRYRLGDGRQFLIRPIQPSDRRHVDEGLTRLSSRSRRLRFHGERDRFSEEELTHTVECDGTDRIALVAVGLSETGEEEIGVGVARAYRDRVPPHRAEAAIVVVDDWQGSGVGRRLLRELADRCLEVGIREWTAQVLEENAAMMNLVGSVGTVGEQSWSRGVAEVVIELTDVESPHDRSDQV